MKKFTIAVSIAITSLLFACFPEEQRQANYAEIKFEQAEGANAAESFANFKRIFASEDMEKNVAARLSKKELAKAGDLFANRRIEADEANSSFKISFACPSANLSEKIADAYASVAINQDTAALRETIEMKIYNMRKEIDTGAKQNLALMEQVMTAKKLISDDATQKQADNLEKEYTAASEAIAEKLSTLDRYIKDLDGREIKSSFKQTKFAGKQMN